MTARCLFQITESSKLPQPTVVFYIAKLTHAVTMLIVLGRLSVRILAVTPTILTLNDFPQPVQANYRMSPPIGP